MTPLFDARGQASAVRLNTLPPDPTGRYETQIVGPDDAVLATFHLPLRYMLDRGDLRHCRGVEFHSDRSDPRFWIRALNVGDLAVLWLNVANLRAEIDRHA